SLENIDEDLVFEFQTNKGIIKLDLRFTDSKTPHFITDTRLTYDKEDIILVFEPLEGELLTLSGNNITNNDYSIDDNILTIDSAIIDEIIEENPDRNRIIFGYQFKLDDKITLGYIFIDID
uniref:hypothetical protein n=1 Tax=Methanocalculus natronophilus TaxID=1262400 RepID=UPI0031B5FFAD